MQQHLILCLFEPYTHALSKAIELFGREENARFRFVTKYNDVDSFLNLKHNGHTEIRFSINTDYVIEKFEHATSSRSLRIEAASKVSEAGYPMGFLIAPVFIYEGWKDDYRSLLLELKSSLPHKLSHKLTFEIISHRYTPVAKGRILNIFPHTELPMNDEDRKFKYGQFGYGKYVYQKEELAEIKEFFTNEIGGLFDDTEILYII